MRGPPGHIVPVTPASPPRSPYTNLDHPFVGARTGGFGKPQHRGGARVPHFGAQPAITYRSPASPAVGCCLLQGADR